MTDNPDIYRKAAELERLDRKIAKAGIDKQSKKQVQEFKRHLFVRGMSKLRISKYIYTSLRLRHMLKKPFKRATKNDIMRVVEELERSDYKPWTKHTYKFVLKKLYKWLLTGKLEGEDYPELVDWIPLSMRNTNHRLPEEILTQDEIKRMFDAATYIRDKAFVHALYESGCRIGEFLGLRLKNIEFDKCGSVLIVEGKMGMRRVRVVASAPTLGLWCDNHPCKDDPNALVWVSLASNRIGKPLDYGGASKLLRTLARRAKVKKRVNPHSFRHARATHLANSLTESQMKELFGWIQASKMASVYVHLSGRDVDHALLELYGLAPPEDKTTRAKPQIRVCPRCNEQNAGDSKFCKRCAFVLDLKEAKEMERGTDILDRLLEDPHTRKLLVQKLYELEYGKKAGVH